MVSTVMRVGQQNMADVTKDDMSKAKNRYILVKTVSAYRERTRLCLHLEAGHLSLNWMH